MATEKRERKRQNQAVRRAALEAARKKQERQQRLKRGVTLGTVAVVAVVGLTYLLTRGGDDNTDVASDGTTTTTEAPALAVTPGRAIKGETPCPKADGTEERATSFEKAPPTCTDPAKTYVATVTTDKGAITIELDPKKAPKTVNNFVVLARYHFYDGIAFHRVVKDFVIQAGDPQGTGAGGPGYEFADELPKPEDYKEGSLAMANSGPNTNGSQFFVVTSAAGAKTLVQAVGGEAKYNLFGQVTAGMDVVKAIEADGPEADGGTPKAVHKITSVTIDEK